MRTLLHKKHFIGSYFFTSPNDEALLKPIRLEEQKAKERIFLKQTAKKFEQRDFEKVQFFNGYEGFIDNRKAYRIFTEKDNVWSHHWNLD